jgi:hypothetical protein
MLLNAHDGATDRYRFPEMVRSILKLNNRSGIDVTAREELQQVLDARNTGFIENGGAFRPYSLDPL